MWSIGNMGGDSTTQVHAGHCLIIMTLLHLRNKRDTTTQYFFDNLLLTSQKIHPFHKKKSHNSKYNTIQ